MKLQSISKLRKPLQILFSISLIAAGLCLMWACLSIYRSGNQPFSRESVAAAFRPISIPVYLCLALAAVSAVFELAVPSSGKKTPPVPQTAMQLHRAQARTDVDLCGEELREQILELRHRRKLFHRISMSILILSSLLFLTYGMNADNFHSTHINQSMLRAMIWLLPCAGAAFLCGLFSARKALVSMEQELTLLKAAPKEARIAPPKPRSHRRRIALVRTSLLAVGIVILVYGFLAGGTADVLTKAVNICTECVGLG